MIAFALVKRRLVPHVFVAALALLSDFALLSDGVALAEAPGEVDARPGTSILPKPLSVSRLPNGMSLVLMPIPSAASVAYYTLIRAGSRDEVEPGKSGYAHLFEHLMFRGTETMTAADYEKKMQAMGADNNAFTTEDFTLYTPTIPAGLLPSLIAVEADRFQHLSYSLSAYKDETGAVLGEYNKAFAHPNRVMEEALRQLAFRTHTYGHTAIGKRDDVVAMPLAYDYSRSFFRRFYTPDDCVVIVVGNFDAAKTSSQIREFYKDWKGRRAPSDVGTEPEQDGARRKDLVWKNPTAPRMLVGYRIPSTPSSLRSAAAYAALAMLVFDRSSSLFQRLVVQENKLISLGVDAEDLLHRDPGLFLIEAKLRTGTSFDEVMTAIEGALAQVAKGELDPRRLDSVKRHMRSELTLRLQTPRSIARELGLFTGISGDPFALESFGAALVAIGKEDLARAAATLRETRRNLVTLSPPAT